MAVVVMAAVIIPCCIHALVALAEQLLNIPNDRRPFATFQIRHRIKSILSRLLWHLVVVAMELELVVVPPLVR